MLIVDKIKISDTDLDRRIKLTPEQKQEIKDLWEPFEVGANKKSNYSIHSLAKEYSVSRRLISSIVRDKPIKQTAYIDKRDFPSSSIKYRTDKTASHRQYKKDLLQKGLIHRAESQESSENGIKKDVLEEVENG